jgi:glycerate dehydrogenase
MQLTENWNDDLFSKLKSAGGSAFSNYAVGYNNVDVAAATKHGIPVGNTPGVLTDTTAEIGAALTLSAVLSNSHAGRCSVTDDDMFSSQ